MKRDDVIATNEYNANIFVARFMLITVGIFLFVFLLNILGIFVIKQTNMIFSFSVSSVLLVIPTLLNKIAGVDKKWLKYVYTTIAALFILLISTMLTYHAVVVYAYPIAIAGLYFSKKLTFIATVESLIATVSGQFLGYYLNFLKDYNFTNLHELVFYSIIPRTITLICFALLFMLITRRTERLLKRQEMAANSMTTLHNDMIMGFATLVEGKDASTGGHIKRTGLYVELIANELRNRGLYCDILTDNYIDNLKNSASMHDIGKIAIPDSILKKPGRLTNGEFEQMKTHTVKGGQIIKDTFSHVDESFKEVAYNVAVFHHEKWNGNGYPESRRGSEIPLCARIMAVADVFDAISQKRCYRDALPFYESLRVIHDGRGEDFEPVIVDAFMSLKNEVKAIYEKAADTNE